MYTTSFFGVKRMSSLEKIRISIGTAGVLGLVDIRLDVPPTTAYLMTYTEGNCIGNCAFCAQARDGNSERDHLSRVIWPAFQWEDVLKSFRNPRLDVLERVCIQIINYPGFIEDVYSLVKSLKENTELPISVDTCPLDKEAMNKLKQSGVERISIPLDAATESLFDSVKGKYVNGPYRWENHLRAIENAVEIFGEGMVGSNLIIGFGESEEEAISLIQRLKDTSVLTSLFAFTPLKGTKLEHLDQPQLKSYRRIQVARHLISIKASKSCKMGFIDGRLTDFGIKDWKEYLGGGLAFQTSGCPGCNRPFYNEKPSGPFYNYPRPLTEEEFKKETRLIGHFR